MKKPAVVLGLSGIVVASLAYPFWYGQESVPADGRTVFMSPPPPESQAILRRIQQKQRIADEVLTGRMTRSAALAKFRALNAALPSTLATMRTQWPDASDEELARRNLEVYLLATIRARGLVGQPAAETGSQQIDQETWD